MESKERVSLKNVIEYFACAAIAVEAVFAAFWLFKNIGVTRIDYVAHTYILAADSLVVDDSMGILYALIVKILGHGVLLSVFQMVALTASLVFFSLGAFNKRTALILSGFLAFNPLMLQAGTAISPGALTLACVLFAIGAGLRSKSDTRWYAGLFAGALAGGFLNPDYAYLFAVGGLVFFIVRSIACRKFKAVLLLGVAVSFAVPAIVNGAIKDDMAYGRVRRSPEFLMMQRILWPKTMEYDSILSVWGGSDTEATKELRYHAMLADADQVPENLAMEFAYRYEKAVGVELAENHFYGLTKRALEKGPRYWAGEVIRDEALYLFAPASAAYMYLKRQTDTSLSSGLNFLFGESPKMSVAYFMFASAASVLLVILCIVKRIADKVLRKTVGRPAIVLSLLGIIVLASLYATFVCVREFDYRNVLFLIVAWPAAAMALTEHREAV